MKNLMQSTTREQERFVTAVMNQLVIAKRITLPIVMETHIAMVVPLALV